MAETLEVLPQSFVVALPYRTKVMKGEVVLVGALEVGDELQAQLLIGVDASLREVHELGDGSSFKEIGRASCRERV